MRALQLLRRLLLIASVPIVAYATAAELQQQAEVQPAAANLKFGAKLATDSQIQTPTSRVASTAVPTRTPAPRRQLNSTKSDEPPAAQRTARCYDAPAVPAAQLVAQYDIPIVKKSRDSVAAPIATAKTAASHKGQRQRSRERAAGATAQRANSQTPPVAQAARARNSHAAPNGTNSNVSQSSNSSNSSSSSRRKSERLASGGRSKSRKATATTTSTSTTTTTTTTTTAATSTATSRAAPADNNPLGNAFNLFSPNFWGFSNPTKPPATKKPPKKYTPSPLPSTVKEKKLSYQKPKLATSTTTPAAFSVEATTTPRKDTTDGPFRIALPTLNFFNGPPQKPLLDPAAEKEKRNTLQSLRERFNCPRESEVRFQLFPKICKIDDDCSVWNRDEICCEIFGAKSCVSGLPKPLEETSHAPILGLIPRKCPTRPLAELWWEVQECETDMDCWPRVCCPDGRRRYCRTSQPELETVPVPVKRSFNYLSEYLECTPAPPPIFDLHPKTCASTLDCFPNVCCQESGLRHCRPPKKSVLTLMANFLNVDFVKRLTQNIVIK